jgi:hypothetical protein
MHPECPYGIALSIFLRPAFHNPSDARHRGIILIVSSSVLSQQ